MALLALLPVLLFPLSHIPCSSSLAQPLSQTTTALCHLGPFSLAPASPPMLFAHFTKLVSPISHTWPSLLRLCSSLEHFIFSCIGLYGIQVFSPFLLPPPARMPGEGAVCSSKSVTAFSLARATAGTGMHHTISRDGRALTPSDVISCSKFS